VKFAPRSRMRSMGTLLVGWGLTVLRLVFVGWRFAVDGPQTPDHPGLRPWAGESGIALFAATRKNGSEELGALLRLVLGEFDIEVRLCALQHVLGGYRAVDVSELLRLEQVEANEPRLSTRGFERSLVSMLACSRPSAQQAAARALGDFGTLGAIEPLLPLAGVFARHGGVRRAAREAIDRIQGRLGGAAEGALALAVGISDGRGGLAHSSGAHEGRTAELGIDCRTNGGASASSCFGL